MNQSTIKIINNNSDRIMRLDIYDKTYIAFTLMRHNLVVIETGNYNALLYNRSFDNNTDLSKAFDKIIITATKIRTSDEFISHIDTYIFMHDINNNDMIEDINRVCNIILEKEEIE